MKKLFVFLFAVLIFIFIPIASFAQPVHYVPHPPVPYSHYKRILYCYNVILPVPHSKCEYRYVRVNYIPAPPPPPRRYTPASPHKGHPGPLHHHSKHR